MKWVRENWQWAALNLAGLAVMASLLWQAAAIAGTDETYNLLLLSSGKWAIRFLLLSLAMTPLNSLLGWRGAVTLRKPAGLWAFGFAAAHFVFNVAELKMQWLQHPIPDYLAGLGMIGLTVLTLMAATSTRWAMKQMGRWWKRLHRLVYAAGLLVVVHALMEVPNKRVAAYEPQVGTEIGLYLAILAVLLVVRIPAIRAFLAGLRRRLGARRDIADETA